MPYLPEKGAAAGRSSFQPEQDRQKLLEQLMEALQAGHPQGSIDPLQQRAAEPEPLQASQGEQQDYVADLNSEQGFEIEMARLKRQKQLQNDILAQLEAQRVEPDMTGTVRIEEAQERPNYQPDLPQEPGMSEQAELLRALPGIG